VIGLAIGSLTWVRENPVGVKAIGPVGESYWVLRDPSGPRGEITLSRIIGKNFEDAVCGAARDRIHGVEPILHTVMGLRGSAPD
jgi:hypothetical protein